MNQTQRTIRQFEGTFAGKALKNDGRQAGGRFAELSGPALGVALKLPTAHPSACQRIRRAAQTAFIDYTSARPTLGLCPSDLLAVRLWTGAFEEGVMTRSESPTSLRAG
ncbi:MAG TPA: hypothetical protein VKV26_01465 [Dehalococcoidia bacterium]|nr:hypothetical protein [Dehalococcoidia bacterium]